VVGCSLLLLLLWLLVLLLLLLLLKLLCRRVGVCWMLVVLCVSVLCVP
jgi:hypothetical protein